MKTVILAGGFGTRLSEETQKVPKPMIKIGRFPIIHHIIKIYESYGFNDFIICGGYKFKILKNYFKNIKSNSKIIVINTGLNTMTGGRILKIKNYIKKDNKNDFLLTYGDGLSDVNIKGLIDVHKKKNVLVTLTAVKQKSKFGSVKFKRNTKIISSFKEKPEEHYISGGFFVVSKKIFKYIKNSQSIFEFDCLPNLTKKKKLQGYKHFGFWHCLDTMKDKIELEKIWKAGKAPWKR
jgi:glucose-1-phosphate cytidylyltransferase